MCNVTYLIRSFRLIALSRHTVKLTHRVLPPQYEKAPRVLFVLRLCSSQWRNAHGNRVSPADITNVNALCLEYIASVRN
jgi:hypothetical protein